MPTASQINAGLKYGNLLFIDRNAEISKEDLELIEKETGIHVVLVAGSPHAMVMSLATYRP